MKPVDIIRSSVERVAERGFKVRPGAYGVRYRDGKWSCPRYAERHVHPLAAVALTDQPDPGPYESLPAAVAQRLGVDLLWVIDFQLAYDDVADLGTPGSEAAAQIREMTR